MKLRNFILATLTAFGIAGLVITPVWAVDGPAPEPRATQSESESQPDTTKPAQLPAPTFSSDTTSDNSSTLWFGKNVVYAGNNIATDNVSQGLLFAAGNNLQLNSRSEYAFAAGNTIVFSATTEKDLFLAGNMININKDAKVGRDIFATGNTFTLEANISGDVSVAARSVILKDVIIKGNVNLDAETITFQGQVQIDGTLSYNDDATVSGLTNVKYGKLETYTPATRNVTASEIWLTKMMSVAGLFFTITIIFLAFPGAKQGIAREVNVQRFGIDLILGLGFVFIVPLLTLIFLLSFFAITTSIFLIGVYCLVFYLATAFAGAWLGHALVEKLCHCTLPMLVEALIGILLITCAGMIPGLGLLVSAFTLILGAGVIIACLRSGSDRKKGTSDDKHTYYAATPEASAKSSKSSRSSQKSSTTKSASVKPATKAASAKSPTKSSTTKTSDIKSSSKANAKSSVAKAKTPKTKK